MQNPRFLLMVVSALFFTIGTSQSAYAMSFGKHNNGPGAANQGITDGNANGNRNGNGNKGYGASLDAPPYQIPVPEPATIILLGSGLLGVGLWRWKKQS